MSKSILYQKYKKTIILVYGISAIEELFNHDGTHKVYHHIEEEGLDDLLNWQYSNQSNSTHFKYEAFDKYTSQFMEIFANDIQKVNRGELSEGDFRKHVGKSDFELFAHIANDCIETASPYKKQNGLLAAKKDNLSEEFSNTELYSTAVEELMTRIKKRSEERTEEHSKLDISTKKSRILEKTGKIVTVSDLVDIGEMFNRLTQEMVPEMAGQSSIDYSEEYADIDKIFSESSQEMVPAMAGQSSIDYSEEDSNIDFSSKRSKVVGKTGEFVTLWDIMGMNERLMVPVRAEQSDDNNSR